jgi:acyl-CoA synthetase (AMP-forming)/AMP-acid ligase II
MAAAARGGGSVTLGFAIAAQRCPDRVGLVDELGTLSWRQLDERANALAAGLASLPFNLRTVGIMCRNHRGFVATLMAADRLGVDVLLLNTSFAGPALAEVVSREDVDVVVYDEEFADVVDRALADRPDTARILGWTESSLGAELATETLIAAHAGQRPSRTDGKSKVVLLTSGTTEPQGAGRRRAGRRAQGSWTESLRAEEVTVIVAPMFHAWGYSQLIFAAFMATTIVTSRRFGPEATLELVDRHGPPASVVPVMLDRIMDLPEQVCSTATSRSRASSRLGSRMRPTS